MTSRRFLPRPDRPFSVAPSRRDAVTGAHGQTLRRLAALVVTLSLGVLAPGMMAQTAPTKHTLFGKAKPVGKLPRTWPRDNANVPVWLPSVSSKSSLATPRSLNDPDGPPRPSLLKFSLMRRRIDVTPKK